MQTTEKDVRYAPAYTVAEAARYLRMPAETLRSWLQDAGDDKRSNGLIVLDNPETGHLSFLNLVEAHVLAAMRRQHHLRLDSVRRALQYVRQQFHVERPLIHQSFQTNGLDLFIEHWDELINVSRGGQQAMKDILNAYLRRIDRDQAGLPIRLYPFTRAHETADVPMDDPKVVVFAPDISFGKPVLAGTGIPVEEILGRFDAGDSADEIASDFQVERLAVEEAIRYRAAA